MQNPTKSNLKSYLNRGSHCRVLHLAPALTMFLSKRSYSRAVHTALIPTDCQQQGLRTLYLRLCRCFMMQAPVRAKPGAKSQQVSGVSMREESTSLRQSISSAASAAVLSTTLAFFISQFYRNCLTCRYLQSPSEV